MVYTKTGDKGTTSLVGGERVKKYDPRVESYGTVDELNSHIGLLAEMAHGYKECYLQLKKIQNKLFVIQTLLATEDESIYEKLPHLKEESVAEMEHWIDEMENKLPKHNKFVIPGGSLTSAQAHVCRTVCRRAERDIVRLADNITNHQSVDTIMKYINRTSDYLFVLSRYILMLEKKEENYWSVE